MLIIVQPRRSEIASEYETQQEKGKEKRFVVVFGVVLFVWLLVCFLFGLGFFVFVIFFFMVMFEFWCLFVFCFVFSSHYHINS